MKNSKYMLAALLASIQNDDAFPVLRTTYPNKRPSQRQREYNKSQENARRKQKIENSK